MGVWDLGCYSCDGYRLIKNRSSSLDILSSSRYCLLGRSLADLPSKLEGLHSVLVCFNDNEPPHPSPLVVFPGLPQLPTLLGDSFIVGPTDVGITVRMRMAKLADVGLAES